ncbi:BglG family transcription antiterminator [Paenibacillus polymyxa]|uniref:BglG family transcription antiterminator n=1 Tax=Paenibacillus TaxID=44249 RepID=UPI0004D72DF3|nr:BglG family transcription antiterminator [Paenibacillus polymyxa]KEO78999.1 PTS sugar transporter subunit IIA [Paenibacillus polymyxa]MCH6187711.1 BglG family transcription antiterminator [Paenibacillus polymyxa]MDY8092721.1 BglG family transcription antiterminator [Paenibacillus polymyxa]WRL57193.1 BglG family transcription antiterminator [Paenibacillus polymyxa]
MNKRQMEILRMLLTEPDRLWLAQDLADLTDCSEKTIRNDLKVIEDYIVKHSDANLVRRPGRGIYLEMGEADQNELFHRLYADESTAQHESDEERVLHLAYRLLMNAKPVTIQDLASQYYVNKTVIRRDMEKIDGWLHSFNLALITKQRVGLTIQGSEKNKRIALARMNQLIDSPELTGQLMRKQFESHEITTINHELKALQKRHELSFTDEAFEALMLHILLMVKRTKMGQPISLSKQDIAFLQERREFTWATSFLQQLQKLFAVPFSKEETAYLTLHLLSGKFRYQQEERTGKQGELADSHPLLPELIEQLVRRMSELNMIAFSKDKMLLKGLNVHLYTTLNRLQYGLTVSNPMLAEIKKMYPYMFDRVIITLEEVGKWIRLSFPEEEAAYLTLHFQASVERLHQKESHPQRAIIVCHMGIGMSQLLRTKVERKFPAVHVETTLSKAEVQDYLAAQEVDLVITTVDLPEMNIPHILVSPLLDAKDERRLEQVIRRLDEPEHRAADESVFFKYTTPFLVFPQQEVQHPEQLISKLAQILEDKGYVEPGYVDSVLAREKMSATTIGGGIAIPHGGSEWIRQSSIVIATLKQPLTWGTEKVELVFLLAVKQDGREEMRQLFKELSLISEQPALVHALSKETDAMRLLGRMKG